MFQIIIILTSITILKNRFRVAFIGSRNLHKRPGNEADQRLCYKVCYRFAELKIGFVSGLCAEGMDAIVQRAYSDALIHQKVFQSQFEIYVSSKIEIDKSRLPNKHLAKIKNSALKTEVEKIAESLHPNWSNCNAYARAQHSRNVHIILGYSLDHPVNAVITWCELDNYGNFKGGTALGLELAKRKGIPIFNLNTPDKNAVLRDIKQWLSWNEIV